MKKLILVVALTSGILISCNSKKATTASNSLDGNWELTYISGPRIAFEGLYPNQKPNMIFNLKENRVMGKNSCNNYSGAVKVEGKTISFDNQGMISTKMFCEGEGENVYMNTLRKINAYSITDDGKTLNLLTNDVEMMRFDRKYEVIE